MDNLVVWAADVGSIKQGRFGYCRLQADGLQEPQYGEDIGGFADRIAEDLLRGKQVALGFECPLFVPVPDSKLDLLRGRRIDGNRPWSAGAGSGALVTGLVECAWVLREIFEKAGAKVQPTLDWECFVSGGANLFLWEAFVSGKAKTSSSSGNSNGHIHDAETAAREFLTADKKVSREDADVFSLAGAALLYTGLTTDREVLKKQCMVIKA